MRIILCLTALMLTVTSCLKNDGTIDFDDMDLRSVEIAAPLGTIHAPLFETMQKQLDFKELNANEEGVLCLTYTHTQEIEWSNDINIAAFEAQFGIPELPIALSGEVDFNPAPFRVKLASTTQGGITGTYVDEANVTGGMLGFTLTGTERLTGAISLTIDGLTDQYGVVFSKNILLPASGEQKYPLDGYKIVTDSEHNLWLSTRIEAVASEHSGAIGVHVSFSEMDVDYVKGYFGQMTSEQSGAMPFDFFEQLEFDGSVGFKDIQLEAEITNNVGMPINIDGDALFVYGNGDKVSLTDLSFFVESATGTYNGTITPGKSIPDPYRKTIPELEIGGGKGYPSELTFNVTGACNPDGPTENFIKKVGNSSLANVDFTFTVPLYLKISEYARTDTIAFDYNETFGESENDVKTAESIEKVHIIVTVDNHLPFDVKLSAVAVNESYKPVENILNPTEIKYGAQKTTFEINLTGDMAKKFREGNVKNIMIKSAASTAGNDYVKVTKNDYIDITVNLPEAKINIPSNF